MKIFLAGTSAFVPYLQDIIIEQHPYVLESFYYVNKNTDKIMPYLGDFMLDSGAFTFCQKNHFREEDLDNYISKYAEYINVHGVNKFFELDIDSIIGYSKVMKYRDKLEELTNKKPIPVWHSTRGKEDFINSIHQYPYVALGGYVAGKGNPEMVKKYVNAFPWFIKKAHENKCLIHGLGYTNREGLFKNNFDSVDSTSWSSGGRYGRLYQFNGTNIVTIPKPPNCRVDSRKITLHNFMEWIKYQKYMERCV